MYKSMTDNEENDAVAESVLLTSVSADDENFTDTRHAVDAARRLLQDDDDDFLEDDAPFVVMGGSAHSSTVASTLQPGSNSMTKNSTVPSKQPLAMNDSKNALLEKIQQRKMQQQNNLSSGATGNVSVPSSTYSAGSKSFTSSDNNTMNRSAEINYYTSYGPSSMATPNTNPDNNNNNNIPLKVPQYSSQPRPNPYDTSSNNNVDYKEKMFDVLSTVGKAANTAAQSAVSGTQYLLSNAVKKGSGGSNNKAGVGIMSSGKMSELDYQRESLLMDPHDLEDGGSAPLSTAAPTATMNNHHYNTNTQNPFVGSNSVRNSSTGTHYYGTGTATSNNTEMINYFRQFIADMKDFFLSSPPYAQALIVSVFLLIVWLIFF
jgi:hypothetical protein